MDTRRLSLADPAALDMAARCLDEGGLVAVPTETVYGLAGDATSGRSVAAIFEAKGRPSFNPLIAHVCDLDMGRRVAVFDDLALRLAECFWPGPMTLVLPLAERSPIHPLATAGLASVAVRMPQGAACELVRRLGRPVAAPSANRSGRVSPTSAQHVLRTLDGRIDMVLDGGACSLGVESTILKPDGVRGRIVLLRPGGLPRETVEAKMGVPVVAEAGAGIEAPGQLASHYAPAGRVRLDVRHVEPGEHLIAFGPEPVSGQERAAAIVNLSPAGDLREAAANLFAALMRFDDPGIETVAVAPVPRSGLGHAINDRLARAAAPR